MNSNSKISSHFSRFLALAVAWLFAGSAVAQLVGGGVPGSLDSEGFSSASFSPRGLSGVLPDTRRFSGSLRLNSSYDTNIGLQDGNNDGAFFLSLGGSLAYRLGSEEGLWSASLNYSPNYRFFFSDQDLPGAFQQSGGLSFSYSAGSLSARLQTSLASGGGQNVLAGGFVNSLNYGISGSLDWRFSGKTSIGVSYGQRFNEIVDQQKNTTNSLGLNASWQATPLVSLGAFVSFAENDLGVGGAVDSTGYGLSFSYTLTGKTSLSARLGLQDQTFEQRAGNTAFLGSVNLAWRPNELYSVGLGLNTNTVALPGANNQIVNNYSLNANVARSLGVGFLSLGVGWNFGQVEETELLIGPATNQEDRRFMNVNLGYSRPIFGDEVSLSASVGYRQGFAPQEFSGINSSLGLTYAF